jgi:signal peptidase I
MPKKRDRGSVPEDKVPASGVLAKETPFEVLASICSVLVIGLFVLTFLGQNFVIPTGSMEKHAAGRRSFACRSHPL